jgi:ankyrin repeat protein
MPTVSLPDRPNLDHLRQQARDLQAAVRAHDSTAVQRIAEFYPGADPAEFTLSLAQVVVARGYGFPSWPRLKRYVEVAIAYRWESPVESVTDSDPTDQFCRLACLNYTNDDPERQVQARQLLADNPGITTNNIWAAAAAADVDTVRRLISPESVRQRGGPYRWTPLFYLAYSRLGQGDALATARLLLDAGADPNEGYLWNGEPNAFTLLTGVFGEGEQGPDRQPVHPQAREFARLLLVAGAEPNDSQTLYNRQFRPNNEHLELLFEYGLGNGDGGPWKARFDEALESPREMLHNQLRWAIEHGFTDRVRLLLRHNVDLTSPYQNGKTPLDLAILEGDETIVAELRAAGATESRLNPVERLIAAVMRGDADQVAQLHNADPDVVERAKSRRPGLIVWATARGRIQAVELLLQLGFDVNALSRSDVPRLDRQWETALHVAASNGNLELARLLLDNGADPTIRDKRFDATPREWAEHGNQPELVSLLS